MTHHSILNNSEYYVFYPALVFCWVHLAIFTLKKLSQKTAEIQLKKNMYLFSFTITFSLTYMKFVSNSWSCYSLTGLRIPLSSSHGYMATAKGEKLKASFRYRHISRAFFQPRVKSSKCFIHFQVVFSTCCNCLNFFFKQYEKYRIQNL